MYAFSASVCILLCVLSAYIRLNYLYVVRDSALSHSNQFYQSEFLLATSVYLPYGKSWRKFPDCGFLPITPSVMHRMIANLKQLGYTETLEVHKTYKFHEH